MVLGETQVFKTMKPRLSCPSPYWIMPSEMMHLFTLLTSVMLWLDHSPGAMVGPIAESSCRGRVLGLIVLTVPVKVKSSMLKLNIQFGYNQ